MTEDDYYKINRSKIDINNISTWQYIPVGQPMRKTYDYYHMSIDDFLERYYQNYSNLTRWNNWMDNTVLPLYEKDIDKFKILFPSIEMRKEWFYNNDFQTFYNEMANTLYFENDIFLFCAFMAKYNFFKDQNIMFVDWISTTNFNIGGRHKQKADIYSLKEMASHKYGNNLVRDKLMNLEWHKC